MENQERPSGRSLRGFASMDKEKQRMIASKGAMTASRSIAPTCPARIAAIVAASAGQ